MADLGLCQEKIWSKRGWPAYPCSRKAVKEGFCKQHHPDTEKARRDANHLKFLEKEKARVAAQKAPLDAAYQKGFDAGYSKGYEEGMATGSGSEEISK